MTSFNQLSLLQALDGLRGKSVTLDIDMAGNVKSIRYEERIKILADDTKE